MTIEITYTDERFGLIEIVLRRATVRDDLNAQNMEQKLVEDVPEGTRGYWRLLAELCSQTVTAKGLPFDPATLLLADKEPVKAAYECFLDLGKGFKDRVVKAMETLERPIDPALGTLPKDADPK